MTTDLDPLQAAVSLEDVNPDVVVDMDKMLFRLRDDCPQTVLLEDSSYRKLRVPSPGQSRLFSIYEGSKQGVILVFETDNKSAYFIHKGQRVLKIEIPLFRIQEQMKPGEAGRFLEVFNRYVFTITPQAEAFKDLDELYPGGEFGSFA